MSREIKILLGGMVLGIVMSVIALFEAVEHTVQVMRTAQLINERADRINQNAKAILDRCAP